MEEQVELPGETVAGLRFVYEDSSPGHRNRALCDGAETVSPH